MSREDPENEASIAASVSLMDAALGEFVQRGKADTRCDRCGGLIVIERIADEVWSVRCDCGKFNDRLRGL